MHFPSTVCNYYGRLFLETYDKEGGKAVNSRTGSYISSELEEIVSDAAKAAASPVKYLAEPTPEPVCSCDYFAHECRFIGMVLKFRCPVHGDVTLDRKVVFAPMVGDTITLPSLPSATPYVTYAPYQPAPTWCPNTPNLPTITCTTPTPRTACGVWNSTAFGSLAG